MKKRLLFLILALCIIISFSPSTLAANLPEVDVRTEGLTPAQPQEAPAEKPRDAGAERRTIYVSNEGTEEDDGATAETPTTLARATELANEGKKPVEIVVLGQVSVDTWTSPTVETTLRGGDENAELLFEYCSASDGAYNISLADIFLADIMVPTPSLPTVIRWSSPRACSTAIIPQTPLLTVKHVAHPAAM